MSESKKIAIEVAEGTIVYEPVEKRLVEPGDLYEHQDEMLVCKGPAVPATERIVYTRRVIEAPKPIPVPSSWAFDEGTRFVRVTRRIGEELRGWFCMDSKAEQDFGDCNNTEASFRADVEQHGGYMVWPREEKP